MRKNCLGYPVEIVEDAFGESPVLADMLKKVTDSNHPRVLIVADANVVQQTEGIGQKIGKYVSDHELVLAGPPVILPGGERIKNDGFTSFTTVVSAALEAKLGADGCMLALGGGTLLDVVGYAAAQVRGGVKLIRMPTTVAAMIEGGFATYAALNSNTIKDAIRVPSTPEGVIVDSLFAKTVLDGVWRAGISEAVRLATVYDAGALKEIADSADMFFARDYGALCDVLEIARGLRMKKGPTTFALWSAMRLEPMSDYKLPHGYSIAIGICIDTAYAVAKGLLKEADRNQIIEIFRASGVSMGIIHSRYLMKQSASIMRGLDAWYLTHGPGIVLPNKLGKSKLVDDIDREAYAAAIETALSFPD